MDSCKVLIITQMNPFISFCLYVAARVFVQYLKSRPKDTQIKASLQFLLSAMGAIKRKNPLTESFLVQLDVDLEGAGLENTTELRASAPLQQSRFASSGGCPNTGAEAGDTSRPPTYGDIGLASYNDPNAVTSIPVTTDAPVKGSTFGAYSVPGLRGQSNGMEGLMANGNVQFELQNRLQRSPGSQQSSGISPRPYNPDMDTSPDGSGGNDRPTPNSSTHSQNNFSSHTSNSTYSPPNMQQSGDMSGGGGAGGMATAGGLFDQNAADSSNAGFNPNDFDMSSFTHNAASTDHQNPGFVMWDGDMHTGFTPGASTGFTPGPMGSMSFGPNDGSTDNLHSLNNNNTATNSTSIDASGLTDFTHGWSEADWNDFMASMDTSGVGGGGGGVGGGGGAGGGNVWETNVEHDVQQESALHERLAKRGLGPRNWPGGR